MCGITGYYVRKNESNLSIELSNALSSLKHRGPNDQGNWELDAHIGLGHTRLSILDLSTHGHQPMVSQNENLVMAFNGEVYNFSDIRKKLEPLGHIFKGTGDSEVILAAFCEWGLSAVDHFIGMFAIALWDRKKEKLFLIRDRLGVKPLYYSWDGQSLYFGSELKALRAYKNWDVAVDKEALSEYLQFGYINAPRSIYKNVFKLPPGHTLELKKEGQPIIHCYWSAVENTRVPLNGTEEELTNQLEALMEDAFKLRMVSDVPVGVFLSGGIDSSVVAAILQKNATQAIHTFTIGFDVARVDESEHAGRVAKHLKTIHTERTLGIDEAKAIVPQWGQLYDEPFADSSGIPTYLVSKIASEYVKVVLSADGGDELFSGYNGYTSVLNNWNKRSRVPLLIRKFAHIILPLLPIEAMDKYVQKLPFPKSICFWLRNNFTWKLLGTRNYLIPKTPGEFYSQSLSIWHPSEIKSLMGTYKPVRPNLDHYPGTLTDQLSFWDLDHFLPDDILTKVDRATMAVSIEGREPLLDHRIVEFALRLPVKLRRGTLGNKHLLRKILYRYVPQELIDRPKQGFSIPLLEWLRSDFSHLIDDYLNPIDIKNQGFFNPKMVSDTIDLFRNGDDHALQKVWTLLAFQMWREKWLS